MDISPRLALESRKRVLVGTISFEQQTHLIANNLLLLFVVEGRDGEATGVVRIDIEVDISKMGEVLV